MQLETIAPFRHSPENTASIPARIRGELPAWLRGEVLRTCPVLFEKNGWHAQHWFDGLGMIYAFRIGDAAVDFRSRMLDSETARDAALGKADLASFGTPTKRSLWQRIARPAPRAGDNANVNIARWGDQLVAMTESNRQHVIDPETLASAGITDQPQDALAGAILMAHPHFDAARNCVVNAALKFGATPAVAIYEYFPATRRRQVIGTWKTGRVPYIHSFGLTPSSAILIAHPFTANPIRMLFSNKGFIDHFSWKPREGTRLVVMNRGTGSVSEHLTDAFFAFHVVNAFESDGATVLDLLAYPDEGIVNAMRVERMAAQLPDLRPSLLRITMRPGVERASTEKLSDTGFEFPSTNYKVVHGRPYRFAWGASNGPLANGTYASAIVKVDLHMGATMSFEDGTHIYGEPLFVARPQGEREDDGVLLSVGSARNAKASVLAVIDARTLALLASAEVPSAIPLGFHGSFVRGRG